MKQKMKYTIAVKTTIAAIVVAVLLLVMLFYMVFSLAAYRKVFRAEVDDFKSVEVLEDLRLAWTDMRSTDIVLLKKIQSRQVTGIGDQGEGVEKIESTLQKVKTSLGELRKSELTSEQKSILDQMQTAVGEYVQNWQGFKSGASKDAKKALAAADSFSDWQAKRGFLFGDYIYRMLNTYVGLRQSSGVLRARIAAGTLTFAAVLLVGGAVVLGLVIRGLVKPLVRSARALSRGMDQLAAGDFTAEVPRESSDEVGDMSENFNGAMSRMRESIRSTVDSAQNVVGITTSISQGSREAVDATAKGADYINSGAAAAEQVSRSIQTVAAGAEEMNASIKEISANADSAAQVAKEASEVAAQTNETVAKLGESSKEIGEVIETITTVAEQTNMLALNATIEAARAGEAGRGFAVVANEVKDLATETGKATEEVSQKVEQIQTDTQAAVSAIEEISKIIASINDYQTTIAAAVEEQTATTNEMSRSVSEAADSSQTIADNVSHIAKQTNDLAEKFTKVDGRMGGLAKHSQDLVTRLNELKYQEN